MSRALLVGAVIVFVLAALGVTVGGASELDLVAGGLALATAAKVIP